MKCVAMIASVLLLCVVGVASTTVDGDHPVSKIITLLQGLKADAIEEGKNEEVEYAAFTNWCKTSLDTLKKAIADETQRLDQVKSALQSETKKNTTISTKIAGLDEDLLEKELTGTTAAANRKSEAALFQIADKATDDTIKALKSALSELSATNTDLLQTSVATQGALNLLSLNANEQDLQTLKNFQEPMLSEGDRAAHVDKYKFKSEGILELLKKMILKFEDEKVATIVEETNAQNNFELEEQARQATIDAVNTAEDAEKADLNANGASLAEDQGLQDTETDNLEADTGSEQSTDEMCKTKAREWESRSKTRSQELVAMDAAVAILSKATGVRTEAPNNPGLPPAPSDAPESFLQLDRARLPGDEPKMKAVALIRQTAKKDHSRALEQLAQEVSAHLNGPFDDIQAMIQKMIFRLKSEQTDEDAHKLWCDKETSKTNTMKDDKVDKIQMFTADITAENAAVGVLNDEIADATEMISKLNTYMKEATEIRNVGTKENDLAIKDAKQAQDAITKAIAVLSTFYQNSGQVEGASLIQHNKKQPIVLPENPATWDNGYSGVSAATNQPGGIVAVLSQISADFAEMQSKTVAQEVVDQKEFDTNVKDNKIEKARRTQEKELKESEVKRRTDKVNHLNAQKKDTTAQLDKTNQYLTDLAPACMDGDSSYEERKSARTDEAEGLRKAQDTLLCAFKPGQCTDGKPNKGAGFLAIAQKHY